MKTIKISKGKILNLCILFVLACICVFGYFNNYIIAYKSQDLTYHINRFVGLSKAFEDGQILPKIYPFTNNGFGYASPLFYCDLYLYPFAILHHFGLSPVLCFKLCVITYIFIGNIIIFNILNKELNNIWLSYTGVILYLGSTYHLHDILVRSALGEILATTFVPMVIYAIYRILVKKENAWIYLGVSFSLLLMAHLLTTFLYGIFFFVMIVVFIVYNHKDFKLIKNTLINIVKGTLLALLLTSWYLFPMFEQLSSQTFWLSINSQYNYIWGSVYSFKELFDVNQTRNVGIVIIILGFSSLFVKPNRIIVALLTYCVILYLILLGIIPGTFLNIIQFYTRLNVVIFPLLCICCLFTLENIKSIKIGYIVAIIACILSLANIVKVNIDTLNNNEYYLYNDASEYDVIHLMNNLYDIDYNHDELGWGEYLPYTEYVDYNNDSLAIKILDKNGNFVDYTFDYDRNFTEISFSVDVEEESTFMIPLSYYKGYSTYEIQDNSSIKLETTHSDKYKQITIESDAGSHHYLVRYDGTLIQKSTLVISTIALLGLVVFKIRHLKV